MRIPSVFVSEEDGLQLLANQRYAREWPRRACGDRSHARCLLLRIGGLEWSQASHCAADARCRPALAAILAHLCRRCGHHHLLLHRVYGAVSGAGGRWDGNGARGDACPTGIVAWCGQLYRRRTLPIAGTRGEPLLTRREVHRFPTRKYSQGGM